MRTPGLYLLADSSLIETHPTQRVHAGLCMAATALVLATVPQRSPVSRLHTAKQQEQAHGREVSVADPRVPAALTLVLGRYPHPLLRVPGHRVSHQPRAPAVLARSEELCLCPCLCQP